ncbi:MAG: site-specific DNA-methyltransferase [Thaumarchaeota archaeon]|nr:site-specific DNA-methyltransferase [Nitrososphaerota archaeon]
MAILEPLGNKFRKIEVVKQIRAEELEIIKEIGKKFSTDALLFEIDGNSKLILYLRVLDIRKFKETVNDLLHHYDLNLEDSVLSTLISKIESIGSYGIKGGKRIFVDYNIERKVSQRKSKIRQRGSIFYTEEGSFLRKNNNVPDQFVNRILQGNSLNVLKSFPSNCIDIVLTSPPYNFGLGYDTSEDGVDWKRYFEGLYAIFEECIRVLKFGGRIIVNIQPLFSDYIPSHHLVSNFFISRKLIWKGEIMWEKHNYNCKYTAWGSWKSPSSPYLKYTWEFLEIFCKGSLGKEGSTKNIDIIGDEFKKWVYAKWDISPERQMKKYGHPAMFPEELVRRALKLFSYKNDVVLDPFNGVGTTTLVAKKLGRRYVGIDVSEEYCRIAKKRLMEVL